MTWRRHFSKRRLGLVVVAVLLYLGLWFLTHRLGAPQVRAVVVEGMQVSLDVSRRTGQAKDPVYWCSASAYAPFVVHTEYGWQGGPIYGDGGTALYVWFFGRAFRVRELSHWMS